MNRWRRILVQVLVAAQLLAGAPLASALPAAGSDAMPCAEMMGMADMAPDADECPCCPDGVDSIAACLSACAAAVGMTPSFTLSLVRAETPRLRLPVFVTHSRASDPPIKPPPIA